MLTHRGTRRLETPRLILRRITPGDAEAMFRNWANDPEVCKYLSWEPHGRVENTRALVADWVKAYEKDSTYNWVMELKSLGEPVGSISLIDVSDRNLRCELGYCMSRAHWGRGLMTEAARAVVDDLFREVGFNRIQAHHDVENVGSGRVMEKAGIRLEGVIRQRYLRRDGTFADGALRAILREDWLAGAGKEPRKEA